MLVRTLAAAALAAAALATPATAAGTDTAAGGPYCAFHPICDKIAAIVDGSTATESHTICHRIEEKAPWLIYCHD